MIAMERWRFILTPEGEADLDRLGDQTRKRVLEKLGWFSENFDQIAPLPLGGPWKGFFKLRVGDWRIVYEVEDYKQLITIHLIDHRSKIYKRRKPRL